MHLRGRAINKIAKRVFSALFSVVLISVLTLINVTVSAENPVEAALFGGSVDKNNYRAYSAGLDSMDFAAKPIAISLEAFTITEGNAAVSDGMLTWDGSGSLNFEFTAQAALYNFQIIWSPLKNGVDLTLGFLLDETYPFAEAKETILPRIWQNVSEKPRTDSGGNEYAQEQVEINSPITSLLRDYTGAAVDPFLFSVTGGTHTLSLVNPGQGFVIHSISLTPPESTESYKQVSAAYDIKELEAEIITLQGEKADTKSSSAIIPKSNKVDAGMTPASAYSAKINYIGGSSWKNPGSIISWTFTVKTAGYYHLNLRYKQSELVNGDSLRWLKIDGKTPFEEAKTLRCPYGFSWKYYDFSDEEGSPYYFWLDEGGHTLSLEVTAGELSEYYSQLSNIVDILGDEYIKIAMITSESPDMNRDYELFKQIPNFQNTLQHCRDSLDTIASDMKATTGKQSTQAIASMENMSRVLSAMLRSPYIAQQYVKDYYSNYTSLSAWLHDMTHMPLAIDEIQLIPAGSDYINKNAGFFKSIYFTAVSFIASFTSNYQIIPSNSTEKKSVRLWINWGQDQAAVLSSLVNDSFTHKTGIEVRLEIVGASLVNGILSGNFPDVSLNMVRTEPVNLGLRGALHDLSEYSDCEEILNRFQPGADTPYRYKDALYALPDTQSFFLMFYRTDILESLELEVPRTWTEFMKVATVIQRNNMSVYVPYTQITASTTVNAGIGSLNLFPTLMSQSGLSLYNEKGTATNLKNKATIKVFESWTDFYTKYDFYKEADFYNRFKVGVMPLGIAPYSTYMTLYSTAPEIKGRWAIAPIPGNENGNNTVAGAGTGCVIVEKSGSKDEAWEFLKWWTSAATQSRYSSNVESILGMIGRTAVSNVEGFNKLAWDPEDSKVLLEQWSRVIEVPEVPGSYYLSRALDQAYWAVVNDRTSPGDALDKWSKAADSEIVRKIREYS